MLDARYEKEDLNKVIKNQCQYLTETKCNELLKLLLKFEEIFDGTRGTWKTDPLYFELNRMRIGYVQDHIHYQIYTKKCFKKQCLVLIGFL